MSIFGKKEKFVLNSEEQKENMIEKMAPLPFWFVKQVTHHF